MLNVELTSTGKAIISLTVANGWEKKKCRQRHCGNHRRQFCKSAQHGSSSDLRIINGSSNWSS